MEIKTSGFLCNTLYLYSRGHDKSNSYVWYLQLLEICCIVLIHGHQVENTGQRKLKQTVFFTGIFVAYIICTDWQGTLLLPGKQGFPLPHIS